jgi:hypothetical protein
MNQCEICNNVFPSGAWYTNGLRLPRDLNFVNPEYMSKNQSILEVASLGVH